MPITRKCKVCKGLFQTLKSRIAKGNGKYCSRKCNSIGQQRRVKRICATCSKSFSAQIGMVKKGYRKFCNAQCYFRSEEVKIGGKLSKGKSVSASRSGKEHHMWKGNNVGYNALHDWVKRNLGKAIHCEFCGMDKLPKNRKRFFGWANISKLYKRDLADWVQLCMKCHYQFDN